MSTEAPIQEKANAGYERAFGKDGYLRELVEQAEDHSDDDARDAALEELQDVLSIEKLTTDHRNETIEWEILLGTGGPATRVLVRTDERGYRIEHAEYQFQDWFQPWTAAEDQDEEIVRRYAELVGYYEQID